MQDVVLAVEGIAKRFGDVEAVRGLSFEVRAGEIFGLLGPNGAGKTTTIRLVLGLLAPDAGRILLHGQPLAGGMEGRARVGLCPQDLVLFEKLGCLEQLEMVGELYGLARPAARASGRRLLAELGLEEKERALAGSLSGGMKRRLNLALALVHDPDLLMLDEPEAGLDPQSRVRVRDHIRSLARKKTVLLTTHDMDEADRLADRVAVIDRGGLLVCDTPEALKRDAAGHGDLVEIRLGGPEGAATAALAGFDGVEAQVSPGLLTVRAPKAVDKLPALLARLASGSVPYGEVRLRPPSLEDVFLSLTGRSLRE
jgi:ABC-2 type transport system ATP-binding protein